MTETCDTAGVIGPAVNVVAALQVVAALKILAGQRDSVEPALSIVDVWDGTLRKMNVANLRERSNCPACVQGQREWLSGTEGIADDNFVRPQCRSDFSGRKAPALARGTCR